jgi:hypothetical protein
MSLLELERKLGEKDAVMERNCIQTLREYVTAGGQPTTAITMLSENYKGTFAARTGACAAHQ